MEAGKTILSKLKIRINMFFNPQDVFQYDFLLNFVTSERGAGKTFSTLKYCVEEFLSKNEQFVYIRRTDTELEKCNTTLLTQLQNEGYFTDKVFKIKDDVMYCGKEILGRTVSINTAYKLKSVSFAGVKTLIFDEFISENKKYLKDEVTKFLSLVESIGRMRDIRIICLGNQNTKYNPYYIYFNIFPKGKYLTRYRTKSVLIYDFKSEEYREKKKETKFGKLISGTVYGDFMLNNENVSDDNSFVDPMNGFKKFPIANIILEGKNIAVYDVVSDDIFCLLFTLRSNISDIRTINFDNMFVEGATIETLSSHPVCKRISNQLRKGNCRFSNMEVKLLVENFIF